MKTLKTHLPDPLRTFCFGRRIYKSGLYRIWKVESLKDNFRETEVPSALNGNRRNKEAAYERAYAVFFFLSRVSPGRGGFFTETAPAPRIHRNGLPGNCAGRCGFNGIEGSKRSDCPKRVFVYGHNTGGMEAAILASRRDLAGLVVSCTIGRIMDDRRVAFWRQQLNLNLPELYGIVLEPVLVLYGASDFLTRLACHEQIRDVLMASGNRDVTLSVVEGLDHSYAHAKDVKASWDNYATRNF